MRQIAFDLFPGGCNKALSMSYDDGSVHDRRLVEIFNRYGIRGSFFLNSGRLGRDGIVSGAEVPSLYRGHEVGAHTVSHPNMPALSRERILWELAEDRRALEDLVEYPVRGVAYPGGLYNELVLEALPVLGFDYARTNLSTFKFAIPESFYEWKFCCRHGASLEWGKKFLELPPRGGPQLLQVMGHSHEFERQGNWNLIEEFCYTIGGRSDIWYATNIEIVEYLKAVRGVRSTVDGTIMYNPSGVTIWFSDWGRDGAAASIPPGGMVSLK